MDKRTCESRFGLGLLKDPETIRFDGGAASAASVGVVADARRPALALAAARHRPPMLLRTSARLAIVT